MEHRRTVAILWASAALLVAACGGDNSSSSTATAASGTAATVLNVVTTTTQITDFTKTIGGTDVSVYSVLKPNVDPHDYEPTPADLDAIATADVIVKNGVGLEAWFEDTIDSASPKGTIVDASTGVKINAGDPHIWHDPQNVKIMVGNIASALGAADPARKAAFERNRADYTAELDTLDADIKAQIDSLANKKLVTNHDAFSYYVARYGLEFVGSVIPSFDSQAELSPADINDLVAKIKAAGVKAIFSESSLPPKTAEAIGQEAGVKVVAGEDSLYGDTLGPEGSDADTYLKMEAHNTREIVRNLS